MKVGLMFLIQDASAFIRDVLVLFRWQFWGVSLIPVMIGYSMSPQTLEWPYVAIMLVIFGPCLEGAAEAINDYFDVDTDRPEMIKKIAGVQLSGGTGLLQAGVVAKQMVLAMSLFAYAISLILSIYFFPTPFVMVVIAGIFLGVCYSAPPFRFKSRGLLGPLSVGVSFGCVTLLAGFTAGGGFPDGPTIVRMLSLVVTVTGLFLTHQIVDYEADMKTSVRTFCVRHGIRATRLLSGILILLGVMTVLPLPWHCPFAWPAASVILVGLACILTALVRGRITPLVRVVAIVLEATVGFLFLV